MRFLSKRMQQCLKVASKLPEPGKLKNVYDISEESEISISYSEQILKILRDQTVAIGHKGPGGGYALVRPANKITLAEIAGKLDPQEKFILPILEKTTLAEFKSA